MDDITGIVDENKIRQGIIIDLSGGDVHSTMETINELPAQYW